MTSLPPPVLRAIDANINRMGEALRVVEDGLRFVLQDAHLTLVCKALRHRFNEWATSFDHARRTAARNAHDDIGRTDSIPDEYRRADIISVFKANLVRASQAARVLEELSKLKDPGQAQSMEAIRFQVYDLEKSIGILWNSRERLRETHLCVLVDGGPSPEEFDRRVSTLVDCGVDMIQLRDKELDDHQLWQRARLLVKRTAHHRALSIINDRADVAVAVNADGVHLGQEDLPIGAVRSILPADALVGISTHSIQQARQAVLDGADYLGAGPVFPSTTKSFEQLAGLEFLRQVVAEITLPTFAIGGIQPEHMEDVVGTGIARVAVSSAIPRTVDQIPQAVASLQTALPVRSPAWPS